VCASGGRGESLWRACACAGMQAGICKGVVVDVGENSSVCKWRRRRSLESVWPKMVPRKKYMHSGRCCVCVCLCG
jgi:hypothetical protein